MHFVYYSLLYVCFELKCGATNKIESTETRHAKKLNIWASALAFSSRTILEKENIYK